MRNKYVNFIRNKSQNIFCMAILLFVFFSCLYQSNSYASKFSLYDKVEVYNTSGIGLNLRSWYGTSYSVKTILADGTQMTVYGGPYEADGYTWWYLYGYVDGIYDSTGYYYSPGYYYGYAAEDWLKAVSTSCTYSLSSSSKSVGYSGGSSYSVSVSTSSGCSWTATSNASWITITSGSSGSGNGTVYYSVSANTSTSSRTGTMTIAGQTFTVTQEGEVISCTDSYEPNDSSSAAYGHLSSGSSYSGKICTSSDVDWFKVNITSAGTISLSLTVPSSNDYYVELYSPSYSWVAGNHDVSISYNATTTGNYYIRVLGYNGSYNTTSSYTLTYTFTPSSTSKSDLVIQNLSISPTSGNAGSSATVSFKIYNQGSGSANSSTTNIRISSSSNNVYTSDTLLASLSTSSISSGGSSSVNQTVTIPSSLYSGTYYIWVILDANSTANQSDETNDKSYTSFTIPTSTTTPEESDLVIQNLSVSPTSGNAGSSATVSFKIYNQGSGSASSSTTNIRISSSSSNVYTSDTLLASLSTSSISSGGSSSVNQTVTIPNSLYSGTYYIWVILDINSTANQSDETNDKSYTSFTIPTSTTTPEESDLVIQNLSVSPTSGNAGSSATVSFKIYNQGSGSASSSTTNIRISSSSSNVYTSDTLLASLSTSSISSGGSSSVSQTVTIPSSLSSGTYYIWVILDANSTANQSDEDNDKSYTSFKVTTSTSSKSDLVIQNLSVSPTSGNAGSSATVSFKIYNQGSGSANSSTTNIRISSSSNNVYTSDTLLASLSTSSISSGGSSSVNQSVTIPSSLSSGTYYIWVILDVNSTANQSDESNDKSYTSFTVTLPASSKSDLVIDDLSVSPTSGEAGTKATVSFTIRNQGDGDADSSTANIRINTSSSKVTTSNTLLENLYIPEITAGGAYSDDQSVTIPKDSKDATHYIWMILDVNNTANQSDVSNDKDYTEFVVTATKATPTPTPTSTEDENLLEKYAPILYMHDDERFYPINVDVMIDNSELWIKGGENPEWENEKKNLTKEHLMKYFDNEDYYLKLKGDVNDFTYNKYWKENPTVYGRETTDTDKDGEKKTVLQYWFFYFYNDWDDIHEGDWEMIQIILGKDKEPEKISFGSHHGGQTFKWSDTDKDTDNIEHPRVYVTLGGHGNWNQAGDNIWRQLYGCLECTDETSALGDVLVPKNLSVTSDNDIKYTLVDLYGSIAPSSESHWVYWKGFWGKQLKTKYGVNSLKLEVSGPSSPPYIDYIKNDGIPGRWYMPIMWSEKPEPSNYTYCSSSNSKIVIRDLEGKNMSSILLDCIPVIPCEECTNISAVYTEKNLIFDIYSLDGEEVTLKISRYNRDTKEMHEVEFDWLEIPKNGKATLKFSPKKNPDFEIMVDNDLDNVIDHIVMPDYSTQYQR